MDWKATTLAAVAERNLYQAALDAMSGSGDWSAYTDAIIAARNRLEPQRLENATARVRATRHARGLEIAGLGSSSEYKSTEGKPRESEGVS